MSFQAFEKESKVFLSTWALKGQSKWQRFSLTPRGKKQLFEKIAISFCEGTDVRDRREKIVNKILSQCIKNSMRSDVVYIAVLYVCVLCQSATYRVPVFRVKDDDLLPRDCVVIDSVGRKYINWSRYLEKNTWGASYLVYPMEGQVTLDQDGNCVVGLQDQTDRGQVKRVVDRCAIVAAIIAALMLLAGLGMTFFFSHTTPLGSAVLITGFSVGVPAVLWWLWCGVKTVIDQDEHGWSFGQSTGHTNLPPNVASG